MLLAMMLGARIVAFEQYGHGLEGPCVLPASRSKNQLISACTTTTAHALQGAIFRRMNAAQAMAVIDFATIATT